MSIIFQASTFLLQLLFRWPASDWASQKLKHSLTVHSPPFDQCLTCAHHADERFSQRQCCLWKQDLDMAFAKCTYQAVTTAC